MSSVRGDMFSLAEAQVFIPEIWSTDIIRYRLEELVMARFVKRIPFMGRAGDTIRMPRISRLGVRPKGLKQPVYYQSVTEQDWSMLVQRYMESSIMIEDVVEIQSHTNLRSEYTKEISRALARDIDYRLLAERAAIIGADSTSHITSTTPLSSAEILAAIETLEKRRVPVSECTFVFSPSHRASLLAIDKFTSRDYVDGKPVQTGVIGDLYGVPVVVSNNITINSTTGLYNGDNDPTPGATPGVTGSLYYPTQEDGTVTSLTANYYSGMLLHPEAIAMAMMQSPKVTSDFDIDFQASKVVSTQLYDVKLYRPDHAVVISTDEDGLV